MGNKIDITSTAIEKGIDLAKDFLDKLIMPAVEETGLLLKEQVTYWKFKNQVKILNKAKQYCEIHGIEARTISFKLLVPLLESSALEEDEVLQDKWAILLSNMVDSEQNVENHVFPYILGQLSINEFLFLEQVNLSKQERVAKINIELTHFMETLPTVKKLLESEIEAITVSIEDEKQLKIDGVPFNREIWDLDRKRNSKKLKLRNLVYTEANYKRSMKYPEVIPEDELKEYELSNLIRLGLVKEVQETTANTQTLEIPKHEEGEWNNYVSVDVDIDIESNIEHILTELGELFIKGCSEKKKKARNTD